MSVTLTIDGTTMPTPKRDGWKVSEHKIWSKNTGRSTSGKMVGTIIAIKKELEITWPPLSASQIATINSKISNINKPYVTVTFTHATGTVTSMTAYFGDPCYPVYGYLNGVWTTVGFSISGIEQ